MTDKEYNNRLADLEGQITLLKREYQKEIRQHQLPKDIVGKIITFNKGNVDYYMQVEKTVDNLDSYTLLGKGFEYFDYKISLNNTLIIGAITAVLHPSKVPYIKEITEKEYNETLERLSKQFKLND